MIDKLITSETDKAIFCKAIGFDVDIHSTKNLNSIEWIITGKSNKQYTDGLELSIGEVDDRMHQKGNRYAKPICSNLTDQWILEVLNPIRKQLNGRIAEIKRNAGIL